jgi:DNA-binding MarR family transcriptional regulator
MAEPLSSQLSRTLVAFTIEADDEFEHQIPHRTTRHGATAGYGDHEAPWLVSSLMWSMCLRFIPAGGTSVRAYARSAWWLTPKGISTTLRRMAAWWNYLSIEGPAEPGPAAKAKADRIVRPTAGGRRAQDAWAPLTGQIEERWGERLGPAPVRALCSALEDLVDQVDRPLPDCLRLYEVDLGRRAPNRPRVATSLPGLLAQAILAFELEFEAACPVPMAVCRNVLRVLGDGAPAGLPVKDLAGRTGLARDGAEAGLRALERRKLVTVGADPDGGRLRVATLTRAGVDRHQQATDLTAAIEDRWRERYGRRCLAALSDALTPVAGRPGDPEGPLWAGLYRYPDGWRSSLPRPDTLPHHPAVSHRGGYLDGA